MKWLKIAGLIIVGLVLAIFALMGILYVTRGTPTHTVRAFGDPAGPPAASDSAFTESLNLLADTRLTGGHTVQLLFNGNQSYPQLWADLHAAKKSIEIQMYYCKPGQVADSLKRILLDRAHNGVRVLLLIDAFGSNLSDEWQDSLRSAGVRVTQFRPLKWYTLHKANNRSHVRAIIVDDSIGYTGGFGVADYWLGDGHHDDQWRDTNVRFTGPAVAELQAAFAVAWGEATGVLFTGRAFFGAARQEVNTPVTAGMLYSPSALGSTDAERFMTLLIASARKRLYIANAYFIPDADMRQLLIRAARRGVDVRILTAGKKTDVKTVRHAGHATYEELLRGGVRIYEFKPAMLHAKTISVDGLWASVGSMNFDNRSLVFNEESNLAVRDGRVAAQLDSAFLDDLRHAHEFELQSFARRSFFEKILDFGASQIAKLL